LIFREIPEFAFCILILTILITLYKIALNITTHVLHIDLQMAFRQLRRWHDKPNDNVQRWKPLTQQQRSTVAERTFNGGGGNYETVVEETMKNTK